VGDRVHEEIEVVGLLERDDGEVRILLEALNVLRLGVHQVDLLAFERRRTRSGLADDVVLDTVDVSWPLVRIVAAVVDEIGIALEDDLRSRLPLLELERPSANRVVPEIVAELLDRRRRDDANNGAVGEERGVRLAEREDRRRRVRGLNRFQRLHERLVRRGHLRIEDAVEGELHRVGVEVRAIVELDPLPDLEGDLLAVLADLPRLSKPRLRQPLLVDVDQVLVDDSHHLAGSQGDRARRVELIRLFAEDQAKHAALHWLARVLPQGRGGLRQVPECRPAENEHQQSECRDGTNGA
jgi:hypothetical protein